MAADLAGDDLLGLRAAGTDGDIDAVTTHVDQCIAHLQLNGEARMPCYQGGQAGNQNMLRHIGAHRQLHDTAHTTGARGEFAIKFVQCLCDVAAIAEKHLAFCRQRQAVRRSSQELHATMGLELTHGPRDLADGNVAFARHGRQCAQLRYADEQPQVVDIHTILSLSLLLQKLQKANCTTDRFRNARLAPIVQSIANVCNIPEGNDDDPLFSSALRATPAISS